MLVPPPVGVVVFDVMVSSLSLWTSPIRAIGMDHASELATDKIMLGLVIHPVGKIIAHA